MPIPVEWWVSYYDGTQWKDYDCYSTKAEANRVAKFLRIQGNRTKVFSRIKVKVFDE